MSTHVPPSPRPESATAASRIRPYGTWPSYLSASDVSSASPSRHYLSVDSHSVYFVENRPDEDGRGALIRSRRGNWVDVSPLLPDGTKACIRTRVHEYGVRPFIVKNRRVVASLDHDDRLYTWLLGADFDDPSEEIRPLTPDDGRRWGEPVLAGDWVIAVVEDHEGATTPAQVRNSIVRLPLDGSAATDPSLIDTLVEGPDFVSYPAVSPDGQWLAYVSWNFPSMPWSQTDLRIRSLDTGSGTSTQAVDHTQLAGGASAVSQPQFSPDGELVYADDISGWINLWVIENVTAPSPRNIHPARADFANPAWNSGITDFAIAPNGDIMVSWAIDGTWRLGLLRDDGLLQPLSRTWQPIGDVAAGPAGLAAIAATPERPAAVVRLAVPRVAEAPSPYDPSAITESEPTPSEWVSVAKPIKFTTGSLAHGTASSTAHAFYYAPVNPDFDAPEDELPPLIVMVHGGPTSQTHRTLNPGIQFWTSRGFAVVDINYRGSTGFGSDYRRALDGQWGIADAEDCVAAVTYLADKGLIDPDRVAIRGGSAGGFTVLAALTFTDTFTAGASYYGIGDLEALARDTHKFEARYPDTLIAPYPEGRETYHDRSPIHHVDRLSAPMIIFQGSDDKVVPPNQAESMAEAVKAKGLPVELHMYDGEGHGFRQHSHRVHCLESELAFYQKVWRMESQNSDTAS